ncbi:hypothetical protein NN561_005749 [Cricetulus griseus]
MSAYTWLGRGKPMRATLGQNLSGQAELHGAAALSVRTTFPNGPSGGRAVAPLCPPGARATETLLSRPFPAPRLDSVDLRAAGVEEIPEPSGQKRDLRVRSGPGVASARLGDTGRQALWVPSEGRDCALMCQSAPAA